MKSHAGIAGNEYTDAIAKYQANQANSCVADTGIPGAGPGRNPFTHIFWLAKEEIREHAAGTSTGSPPAPKLTYLPNFQDALKFHMHTTHTHLVMKMPKQAPSNRTIPSYLFPRNLSMRDRSTSSQPDAILITSHNAQPTSNSVSSSCSHHALRSRHSTSQRAGTASQ
eukprot:852091-Pelagomonas_calceolata.AAC.1